MAARRSTERGFARISNAYTRVTRARASRQAREIAAWLRPHSAGRVLDAACGPAGLAQALAPEAVCVCALDLCPQMLHQARELDGADPRLLLTVGDVGRLPFPSCSFHLVTCSYAFANFRNPLAVLREYARVIRPGGRIAIIEVVAPENRGQRLRLNRLESQRGAFHTRVRSRSEFLKLFTQAGLGIIEVRERRRRCRFRDWLRLSPAALDSPQRARQLRGMLIDSIDGDKAGLDPHRAGGDIIFYHRTVWFLLRRMFRQESAGASPGVADGR
jgi:ubiquinone/menaquinone biosynthesis C-methylase UbiE